MKNLLLAGFVLQLALPALVGAAVDDVPPIPKGNRVAVTAWDPGSQTYDIENTRYPAQGPNYATQKAFAAAVRSVELAKIRAKPESIVGNSYILNEDLRLESVEKIDAKRASGDQEKR